jgi:SAM-dependent methyltransferase
MTVLELGAGTCWVSHLLNKMGCRTIAVDVSATALAMGRSVFEADPQTNWTLNPLFLPYNGTRLPVDDRSIDAVIIYDAFHHLPNPQHLLREMHRVLTAQGMVGMSEPGRGHAASQPSQAEASDTGVLEDELIVEHLAQMASAAGFSATRRIVASNRPLLEIDATDTGAFMGGRGFSTYWDRLCSALESHYLLLIYKGHTEPTTARPKRLKAHFTGKSDSVEVAAGAPLRMDLRIQNVGDTRWLAGEGAGWTRVGAHLYAGQPRQVVSYDWARWSLPADVAPGDSVTLSVVLPSIDTPGDYTLVVDLVVEGVAWFADRESAALTLSVRSVRL